MDNEIQVNKIESIADLYWSLFQRYEEIKRTSKPDSDMSNSAISMQKILTGNIANLWDLERFKITGHIHQANYNALEFETARALMNIIMKKYGTYDDFLDEHKDRNSYEIIKLDNMPPMTWERIYQLRGAYNYYISKHQSPYSDIVSNISPLADISPNIKVDFDHLFIGRDVKIGADVEFGNLAPIFIEDDVVIERGVKFLTHNVIGPNYQARPIFIGKGTVIGTDANILGGAHVGRGAFLAANSFVTRNVPAGEFWAGNPAILVNTTKKVFGKLADPKASTYGSGFANLDDPFENLTETDNWLAQYFQQSGKKLEIEFND